MSFELQPDVAQPPNGDAVHDEAKGDVDAAPTNDGNEDTIVNETNQTVEEVPQETAESVEDSDRPFSWL